MSAGDDLKDAARRIAQALGTINLMLEKQRISKERLGYVSKQIETANKIINSILTPRSKEE